MLFTYETSSTAEPGSLLSTVQGWFVPLLATGLLSFLMCLVTPFLSVSLTLPPILLSPCCLREAIKICNLIFELLLELSLWDIRQQCKPMGESIRCIFLYIRANLRGRSMKSSAVLSAWMKWRQWCNSYAGSLISERYCSEYTYVTNQRWKSTLTLIISILYY